MLASFLTFYNYPHYTQKLRLIINDKLRKLLLKFSN